MCSDVVIEAVNLSKVYSVGSSPLRQLLYQFGLSSRQNEFWALRPLNLQIRRGEVVGIIGQNGSGKSTLLQLLCGTLQPTNGSAKVYGRLAALLELGAGFNLEFTGRENVFLNATLFGLSRDEIVDKFNDIESFADIGDFIDKPVKTYSSGMFVRLAFAVLAHVDADVLVIDEALAVGDVFFTQKCMRFLEEFSNKGTILFVSHDSASVVNLCNRAILLEHGKMLSEGSPREVTEYYLQRQYAHSTKKIAVVSTENELPEQHTINTFKLETLTKPDEVRTNEFGLGGLQITGYSCTNENGEPLHQISQKCIVHIDIVVLAATKISIPLAGFALKDRHGKVIFGGNTEQAGLELPSLESGEKLRIAFHVEIPDMTLGDYMLVLAVGDGSAKEHIMHHWIHDAWPLQSTCLVNSGLFNVPFSGFFSSLS